MRIFLLTDKYPAKGARRKAPLRRRRTRFYIAAALAAVALFIAAGPSKVLAGEVRDIKAYGKAVNSGNTGEAKKAAVDAALREAVVEAVTDYLEKAGARAIEATLEKKIYSRSENYILNYKILSERWISETMTETVIDKGPDNELLKEKKVKKPEIIETYLVLLEASVDMGSLKKTLGRIVPGIRESTIKLVLLDITDNETYSSLMDSLKTVTAIEELSYESFYRKRFVLSAKTTVDARTLADEIAAVAGKDFVVSTGGAWMIIIKAFPEAAGLNR
ncbi:MAG: hypothetical protein ACE5EB_06865 [Thermodesulfobacteriota bacterium]